MNEVNIYDVTFPIKTYVDEYFGGFSEPVMYDFITFVVVILFIIFCIKIFSLFFTSLK